MNIEPTKSAIAEDPREPPSAKNIRSLLSPVVTSKKARPLDHRSPKQPAKLPKPEPIDSSKNTEKELLKLLSGKPITIITRQMGGFGDILCAAKIYKYMQEKLGIPQAQLQLAINELGPSDILKDEGFNFVPNTRDSLEKITEGVHIFAPAHSQEFVQSKMNIKKMQPILAISEYGYPPIKELESGFDNIQALSFGFTDTSLGYIPSPELRKWASDKHKLSAIQQLGYLKTLPEYIQKAILGEGPDLDTLIELFSRKSKLYFGYCQNSSSINAFIEGVLTMLKMTKDKSDACFYFMGAPGGTIDAATLVSTLPEAEEIHSITLINLNQKTHKEITCNEEGNRNIKIIIGKIPLKHVPTMYMASEEETIVTGDQSFSEALSAEKFPVYELLPHKKTLLDQFTNIFPSDLKSALPSYDCLSYRKYTLSAKSLANFFTQRKLNPEFNKAITEKLRNIANSFDFSSRFDKALLNVAEQASIPGKKQPPVISLPEGEALAGDEIPFDITVYISTDDMVKLKIKSNGVSKHPMYKDNSTFKFRQHGLDFFSLVRSRPKT